VPGTGTSALAGASARTTPRADDASLGGAPLAAALGPAWREGSDRLAALLCLLPEATGGRAGAAASPTSAGGGSGGGGQEPRVVAAFARRLDAAAAAAAKAAADAAAGVKPPASSSSSSAAAGGAAASPIRMDAPALRRLARLLSLVCVRLHASGGARAAEGGAAPPRAPLASLPATALRCLSTLLAGVRLLELSAAASGASGVASGRTGEVEAAAAAAAREVAAAFLVDLAALPPATLAFLVRGFATDATIAPPAAGAGAAAPPKRTAQEAAAGARAAAAARAARGGFDIPSALAELDADGMALEAAEDAAAAAAAAAAASVAAAAAAVAASAAAASGSSSDSGSSGPAPRAAAALPPPLTGTGTGGSPTWSPLQELAVIAALRDLLLIRPRVRGAALDALLAIAVAPAVSEAAAAAALAVVTRRLGEAGAPARAHAVAFTRRALAALVPHAGGAEGVGAGEEGAAGEQQHAGQKRGAAPESGADGAAAPASKRARSEGGGEGGAAPRIAPVTPLAAGGGAGGAPGAGSLAAGAEARIALCESLEGALRAGAAPLAFAPRILRLALGLAVDEPSLLADIAGA
jgi:trimeric autotransporter adhesin